VPVVDDGPADEAGQLLALAEGAQVGREVAAAGGLKAGELGRVADALVVVAVVVEEGKRAAGGAGAGVEGPQRLVGPQRRATAADRLDVHRHVDEEPRLDVAEAPVAPHGAEGLLAAPHREAARVVSADALEHPAGVGRGRRAVGRGVNGVELRVLPAVLHEEAVEGRLSGVDRHRAHVERAEVGKRNDACFGELLIFELAAGGLRRDVGADDGALGDRLAGAVDADGQHGVGGSIHARAGVQKAAFTAGSGDS
jgi:hypothetical protein